MAYINQFFNSSLTEGLWNETPDAETWNGRMWYGRYDLPAASMGFFGHILTQETDGDGWVKRWSFKTKAELDKAWDRIVNPFGGRTPEETISRPRHE